MNAIICSSLMKIRIKSNNHANKISELVAILSQILITPNGLKNIKILTKCTEKLQQHIQKSFIYLLKLFKKTNSRKFSSSIYL